MLQFYFRMGNDPVEAVHHKNLAMGLFSGEQLEKSYRQKALSLLMRLQVSERGERMLPGV